MDFVKETSTKGAFIPHSALKASDFQDNEEATLRTLPNTIILTRRHMTAMELLQTIESLTQTAADLTTELMRLCAPCDSCDREECPFTSQEESAIHLDGFLRQEAGIPEDAKLCAEVDNEAHTVTFMASDHKYDLSDVPKGQLDLFVEKGICLGSLEELLIGNEVVYHG